jgi:glutamine amidotransferase
MIAVVDYGRGNLGSVEKAFARLGMEAVVTQDPRAVLDAEAVVLPGDGAFHDAMRNLEALGLLEPLRGLLVEGRPFLGICLGYQLLFSESEEFGHGKGLDLIPGLVRRLPQKLRDSGFGVVGSGFARTIPDPRIPTPELKIPHMGWNTVSHSGDMPIFDGIPSGAYFYFVHSYYPEPRGGKGLKDGTLRMATCTYGVTFPAALAKGKIFGTQFHPEKSQRWGLKLLENFARVVKGSQRP